MQHAQEALASMDSVAEVASIIRIEDISLWTEGVFQN